MNKVILMGRLTRDPEVRTTGNTTVARYSIAVDRRFKNDNEPTADFINLVAFGKSAEFAEKYFKKGTKILVTGRIQTGSYKNKDGQTVYTTDVVVEEQEFAESKGSNNATNNAPVGNDLPLPNSNPTGGFAPVGNDLPPFMNIPQGYDEQLPFAKPTR